MIGNLYISYVGQMSWTFSSFGEIKENFVDYNIFDEDCNLYTFEQIVSISEPTKEPVNREFMIFRKYQLDGC
jgi:NADPH-dependent 7-cyano-7-deazaguanine reductase QueF